MTRIDHDRNGRPAPQDDGAPEAELPIARGRPGRVPGAVAGGRRPEPPAEGNGAAAGEGLISGRWQSVRLRLGDGDAARPGTGAPPGPPAPPPPPRPPPAPPRRRRGLRAPPLPPPARPPGRRDGDRRGRGRPGRR